MFLFWYFLFIARTNKIHLDCCCVLLYDDDDDGCFLLDKRVFMNDSLEINIESIMNNPCVLIKLDKLQT